MEQLLDELERSLKDKYPDKNIVSIVEKYVLCVIINRKKYHYNIEKLIEDNIVYNKIVSMVVDDLSKKIG